jgi:hypothetical protein
VRAAVGEALAPVQQAFRNIERRLDDLERRPVAVAPLPTAAIPGATAHMRPPQATVPGGAAAPGAAALPVSMPPIPITVASLVPRAPLLDVAAIERDANIQIEGALDGRRRKVRLAVTFVLLLLVVFGGLFAALAYSYAPHPSTFAPSTRSGERLGQGSLTSKGASLFV